jgi:hypothetical protein
MQYKLKNFYTKEDLFKFCQSTIDPEGGILIGNKYDLNKFDLKPKDNIFGFIVKRINKL